MPEVLASWPFFAGCRIFTTSISTLSHQIDPAMDSVFREIPAEFGNIQRIVMIPARRGQLYSFGRAVETGIRLVSTRTLTVRALGNG